MTMTFPLIAFFLWLVSTYSPSSGADPSAQFIALAGIQDPTTKTTIMNAAAMLPTDGTLETAQIGFTYWRTYFADTGAYPKSCRVSATQIAAIANLSDEFLSQGVAPKGKK